MHIFDTDRKCTQDGPANRMHRLLDSDHNDQMAAPYSAKAVANFFLEREHLTQMKLHKLMYYAHGWHLGFREKPLLDETLEAWHFGPVARSIFWEFRSFGASPINRLAREFDPIEESPVRIPRVDPEDRFVQDLLARTWKVYSRFTAGQLSRLTHLPGSPWTDTRNDNPGVKYAGIPNALLRSHFRDRVSRNGKDG